MPNDNLARGLASQFIYIISPMLSLVLVTKTIVMHEIEHNYESDWTFDVSIVTRFALVVNAGEVCQSSS